MSKPQTILILGNSRLVVFGFRGELIKRLIDEGYRVVVSFPNGPFGQGEQESKQYGCEFIETEVDRRGTNPLRDLSLLRQYIHLIRKIDPDLVFTYTVKCDVYGGIACRLFHKDHFPNITGLGKGLSEGGVITAVTKFLYRISTKKSCCVFFQNSSDKSYFDKNIEYKRGTVLPGSGVNLDDHMPLPYPDTTNIIFTFIGRVMRAKGIEQFIDAATFLKKKYHSVEFHICGYCEEDYKSEMERLNAEGVIVYHGLVKDTTPYEEISHCIVLPSFHPEGVSNVLLEGAAAARPLITTDRPGCRETVDDGVSGYLVREKDSKDLIDKMEMFLDLSESQKKEMGRRGREKMEREFDRNIIVNAYLGEI
ncbi:glycosyltransferase family 4 protein, partial [Bifidobacterium moukalabense]|uniref:glycosyltransferase family 4 protein n=1 Tax=Bifidobacterium moukalabense TaxID=1333651 RepID=UPI0010F43A65